MDAVVPASFADHCPRAVRPTLLDVGADLRRQPVVGLRVSRDRNDGIGPRIHELPLSGQLPPTAPILSTHASCRSQAIVLRRHRIWLVGVSVLIPKEIQSTT